MRGGLRRALGLYQGGRAWVLHWLPLALSLTRSHPLTWRIFGRVAPSFQHQPQVAKRERGRRGGAKSGGASPCTQRTLRLTTHAPLLLEGSSPRPCCPPGPTCLIRRLDFSHRTACGEPEHCLNHPAVWCFRIPRMRKRMCDMPLLPDLWLCRQTTASRIPPTHRNTVGSEGGCPGYRTASFLIMHHFSLAVDPVQTHLHPVCETKKPALTAGCRNSKQAGLARRGGSGPPRPFLIIPLTLCSNPHTPSTRTSPRPSRTIPASPTLISIDHFSSRTWTAWQVQDGRQKRTSNCHPAERLVRRSPDLVATQLVSPYPGYMHMYVSPRRVALPPRPRRQAWSAVRTRSTVTVCGVLSSRSEKLSVGPF